jgi:hypothetical protein
MNNQVFKSKIETPFGLDWGMNVEKVKTGGFNIIKLEEEGNNPNCNNYMDYAPKINGLNNVNMTSINFSFYKDKLYRIMCLYSDNFTFKILKSSIEKKYGTLNETPYMDETFYSISYNDNMNIYLSYSYDTDSGALTYIYTPIGIIVETENGNREEEEINEISKKVMENL